MTSRPANLMILMFLLITFLLLSIHLEKRMSYGRKKKVINFSIFIIAVLASIRSIGPDTQNYKIIFENIPILKNPLLYFQNSEYQLYEFGFTFIASLVKKTGNGFTLFSFLYAVVPLFIIGWVVHKQDKNNPLITFSLFLLFYLFRGPNNIIRHFFASAIYLLGLHFLSQDKKIKFYIFGTLSALFHYANAVTVFFKPFLSLKNNKINSKRYLSVLMILLFMGGLLNNFVLEFAANLDFNVRIFSRLTYYLVDDYNYYNLSHFLARNLLENLPPIINVISILFVLRKKHRLVISPFENIILNSLIVGTFIYSFLMGFGAYTMAYRFDFLFGIGNMFISSVIINQVFAINKMKKFSLMILLFIMYNFIVIYYYSGII